MKKSGVRGSRGSNTPKGNLKISAFFQKQTPSNSQNIVQSSVEPIHLKNYSVFEGVNINSNTEDGGCVNCISLAEGSNNLCYHRSNSFVNDDVHFTPSKSEVITVIDDDTVEQVKKRKHVSSGTLLPETKRKSCSSSNADCQKVDTEMKFQPIISVKTPDKLYGSASVSNNSLKIEDMPEEISRKVSPLQHYDMNLMMSKLRKTPSKTPKKSPKTKLFHKSPAKLANFNVHILENFVKVTPSKSNKRSTDSKSPESNNKIQVSILNYLSPQGSSSAQAQKLNETTPRKNNPMEQVTTPISKAKLKLDFSSCDTEKIAVENIHSELTIANLGSEFDHDWDIAFNDLNLNLQKPKHCKILESITTKTRITLKVQSTSSDDKAVCHLEDFWVNSNLKPGDIIFLNACKNSESDWLINNESGLLVYEPDLLISTTSVVRSVYCMRRSVLAEKFQGFDPINNSMVIGVLVHSLLQNVLKKNLHLASDIENEIKDITSSNDAIRKMYEASSSIEDVMKQLKEFIPRIVDFVHEYVQEFSNQSSPRPKRDQNVAWNGTINSVDDIEEIIWCPQLGLKGKVDVSVRSKDKIYPLELKTGKASISLEHRGQVILYVMMMNTLGYEISSGLLHYLKEGLLTEINVTHRESRDIILMRNELAYYLTRVPKIVNVDTPGIQYLELPEPIDHANSCKTCNFNTICSAYVCYERHDISRKKGFAGVKNESLKHLTKNHLDYFILWTLLLSLENISQRDGKPLRDIYTMSPDERTRKGRCINSVIISKIEMKTESSFEHVFRKTDSTSLNNFLASGIMENNYVVVSTDDRPSIGAGFVVDISTTSVTINLDRDLSRKYADEKCHLDTYDSLASTGFNMTSLALLLENSPRSNHLRKIIIEKEPPTFLPKLPKIVAVKSVPILKRLNKCQQRAVLKSLTAKDYLLIKGMPGTGKTATIVALVQLLVEVNKTVLITSHTHSAIDNICVRLQKFGVDVLRLGSMSRINEKLKRNSEYNLTRDCKTPEEIEEVFNEASVIAVTCLGSGHPLLSKRTLDICLVDECTQVIQPSVFRALHCAKTFVLIGDPDQLAPTIRNKEAIIRGMSESLFERLQSPEACVSLNENYRMNKTITALANSITYNGELKIGSDSVAHARLHIPKEDNLKKMYDSETWILKVLNTSLDSAVQIIDTCLDSLGSPLEEVACKSYTNIYEAAVVTKITKVLLEGGVSAEDIGVIATYRDQVAHISKQLTNVNVSTVDQFQGSDKKIILYSCTKYRNNSNAPISEYNLLEDHRRLTVAVTRAKHKLIVIGELNVVQRYKPFYKMLTSLDSSKFVKLVEGEFGFSWKTLMNN